MEDSLCVCKRCSSQMCYEQKIEGITTWKCLNCGFSSNELLIEGSQLINETEEVIPELYKDIKFIDDGKQVWYPIVLNIPDKGTIFVNGTDKDNWGWAGIKSTETTEEEKQKLKGATYKSDPKTLKMFNKDEFVMACNYVGLI